MDNSIIFYKRMVDSDPSVYNKKLLALEYYKSAAISIAENNICRLYLELHNDHNDDKDNCKNALNIMEELFNKDPQINDIIIKEHFHFSRYKNLNLQENIIKSIFISSLKFFADKIGITTFFKDYDEFFYLRKSSTELILSNPVYLHYLAYLEKNMTQREKYLEMAKDYSPSVYELGLIKKQNGKYIEAIKHFRDGYEKGDFLSSYSLSLLDKNLPYLTLMPPKDKENSEISLYIFLFHLLNKNNYQEEMLKQCLNDLDNTTHLSRLKSFKSLISILEKEKSDRGDLVLDKEDYHNLDGHALAILGYLAFQREIIDSHSYSILVSKRNEISESRNLINPKLGIGSEALASQVDDKKRVVTECYFTFTTDLFKRAIMKGYKEASLFLGKLYYEKGDYLQAKKYLIDSYNYGNVGSCYLLGKLFLQEGLYEEAHTHLSKSSEINSFSKYILCTFHAQGYYFEQNIKEAQKCLNSMSDTNNSKAKGLVNYMLAVLNMDDKYGGDTNLENAKKYIENAKKYISTSDTAYLDIIINIKNKKCSNIKEQLFENMQHDMYFKYLMAADYIKEVCLTKDIKQAQALAKEIIGNPNFNDKKIIECAIEIIKNKKVENDCMYPHKPLDNVNSFDNNYIEPLLSDLFKEESFLSLPNLGLTDMRILSFEVSNQEKLEL